MATVRALSRLHHDVRVLLFALGMAVPGAVIALALTWSFLASQAARWTLTALVLVCVIAGALALRAQVVRPLQLLTNLLSAVREGDLTLRVGEASRADPLGAALLEAGGIADILREQRLDSLEAAGLLGAVMAEVEVAVFAFDGAGAEARLVLVNRAGARLLRPGDDRGDALKGRTARELGLAEALLVEGARTLELPLGASLSGRWEARTRPFRQGGRPHRVLVLSDLRRALREEEREAWRKLVRVLSHEINNSLTPIQSIAGSLRALLERSAPPGAPGDGGAELREDLRAGLATIGGRAESVARFMAAYARLARLPAPRLAPIDVGTLVRRTCALEARCAVEVVPGPPVELQGDADQLEQLLINLVQNAVEASLPAGGPVQATWALVEEGALELRVLDRGPGPPPSKNLFVPFFTTKPGGSGIGLVLSRQIAEAHGGMLTLRERADGRGCEAALRLPLGGA